MKRIGYGILFWNEMHSKKITVMSTFCTFLYICTAGGHRGRDRMMLGLPVQSVPITIKVVSSNTARGKMYSIQHYVIKFVSDLLQVCGFLWVLQCPLLYNWNIVESGIKHYSPNPKMYNILFSFLLFYL